MKNLKIPENPQEVSETEMKAELGVTETPRGVPPNDDEAFACPWCNSEMVAFKSKSVGMFERSPKGKKEVLYCRCTSCKKTCKHYA